MTRASLLFVALALGCASRLQAVMHEPDVRPCMAERAVGRGLERSAWGVVLLIADRAEGQRAYGAGIVLDDRAHVLTSGHVVEGAHFLRAVLYRPGRRSYTPMDGGLSRFLDENESALVGVELVRADPELDVALIRVAADTVSLPKPIFSRTAPHLGQPIFALGHPNESVWSFTAGVVSSVRDGLIQHDAALGSGSSGGPLLDASGRVVGINTSKLFEPAEGIGFARPIGATRHLLPNLRNLDSVGLTRGGPMEGLGKFPLDGPS